MSRLKGADLGVQVPTGTMNYRGAWTASPSPAYAISDVVLRNGALYSAIATPGSFDPSTPGLASPLASITSPATAVGSPSAQFFTLTAAGTINAVKVTYAGASTGGLLIGLASGIPGGVPTWLGKGTSKALASGSTDTIYLDTPVSLAAGGTAYLVCYEPQVARATVLNGLTTGNLYFGTNFLTSDTTIHPCAELDFLSPWQALGATTPLNHRGAYSSSAVYAANDTALDAGLLWLALGAIPAGAGLPSTNPTFIASGSVVGAMGQGGGTSVNSLYNAQQFTVGGSPLTVGVIGVTFAAGTAASGVQVGIATAIGANPGSVTWVGSGPSAATAVSAGAGVVNFTLPAPITLAAGATYYVVVMNISARLVGQGSNTVSGGIASTTTTFSFSSGSGVAWGTASGATMSVQLSSGGVTSYWQVLSLIQENVNTVVASGAAVTLPDVPTATMHRITLTANTTITLPTPGAGKSFTVELVQDATGGRTVTWATPSGAIRWPGGTAPTITATANAIDVITFVCIGGTNWYGFIAGQAFA